MALQLTMCATAEMIWAKTSLVSRSLSFPLLVILENRSPPLPYSITRYSLLLVSITSYRRTTFGWHSFSMQLISEEVKDRLFLSRRSLSMTLTATLSETGQKYQNKDRDMLKRFKLMRKWCYYYCVQYEKNADRNYFCHLIKLGD